MKIKQPIRRCSVARAGRERAFLQISSDFEFMSSHKKIGVDINCYGQIVNVVNGTDFADFPNDICQSGSSRASIRRGRAPLCPSRGYKEQAMDPITVSFRVVPAGPIEMGGNTYYTVEREKEGRSSFAVISPEMAVGTFIEDCLRKQGGIKPLPAHVEVTLSVTHEDPSES